MKNWPAARLTKAATAAGIVGLALSAASVVVGQGTGPAPARTRATAKPDLSGIWQALNTAYWNVEDHPAGPGYSNGPAWMLGALVAEPPGVGIVEGGKIPYLPAAVEKKRVLLTKALVADVYKPEEGDPEMKCFLPGIPRALYMPYPFQILQTDKYVNMSFTFANANRVVYLSSRGEPPIDSWMGWANGRWEGDTLVVNVNGFNGFSWFDRAGNFMSENTKLTERYTRIDADHLRYQVTVEDPTLYTRPWKMSMSLYRIIDPGAQIFEFKCVQYAEQAMFGRLTKNWKPFVWDPLTQMAVK